MCKKSEFFNEVSPWILSKNDLFTMCAFFGKPRKIRALFILLDRKQ